MLNAFRNLFSKFIAHIPTSKYFDTVYFARFILIYVFFKAIYRAYFALIIPGGLFVPSIKNHFNIMDWAKLAILLISQKLCSILGYTTIIQAPNLYGPTNCFVVIGGTCLGFGIMILWSAYLFAFYSPLRKKLRWMFSGILIICIANCVRVSLLLIAMENRWHITNRIDHHTLFNWILYSIVLFMMYRFSASQQKKLANTQTALQ